MTVFLHGDDNDEKMRRGTIKGRHVPLSVLGVSDRVTDDVLEEDLEDATGLFVDKARDTLDTTTAGKTSDGGLGDTCKEWYQHNHKGVRGTGTRH